MDQWEVASPLSPLPSSFTFSEPFCQLQSVRHLSIPVAVEFKPRMNCPLRFGRQPPPSASLQFAGQLARLNAMTAPGGTAYWIISFHLSFVRVSPGDAVRVANAAYAPEIAKTDKASPEPMTSPWENFFTISRFSIVFQTEKYPPYDTRDISKCN